MWRNPSQNAAFFTKTYAHSHLQFPRSTLGTPGFLHRCFLVFRNINLKRQVVLGCCLLVSVTNFQGKLASLQQASSPNSQDNFQICCADIYLVRCLANFACFCEFRGISRIYLKFAASRPREILEALSSLRNDVTDGEVKEIKSEYVYTKKNASSRGGGGGGVHTLHPPSRSAPGI